MILANAFQVKAPFNMPAIKEPDFSRCKKLLITDLVPFKGTETKLRRQLIKLTVSEEESWSFLRENG